MPKIYNKVIIQDLNYSIDCIISGNFRGFLPKLWLNLVAPVESEEIFNFLAIYWFESFFLKERFQLPPYNLIIWLIGLATSAILHQAILRAEARSGARRAPVNTRNMLDGWSVLTGIASTLFALWISHLRNKIGDEGVSVSI